MIVVGFQENVIMIISRKLQITWKTARACIFICDVHRLIPCISITPISVMPEQEIMAYTQSYPGKLRHAC